MKINTFNIEIQSNRYFSYSWNHRNKWIKITNHKIQVSSYMVMKAVDRLSAVNIHGHRRRLDAFTSKKRWFNGRKMVVLNLRCISAGWSWTTKQSYFVII